MKTPYTDFQMNKIARAVTWMIEHDYWVTHFIWERDAAITDICLKYFTFNDCSTVCYIVRYYLRKLLDGVKCNGQIFTRRQEQIKYGLMLTLPVTELKKSIDLTPRAVKGVSSNHEQPKPIEIKNTFATKFKEHFGIENTKDDWNLYQREKRYYDSYGLCSWENPNYSIIPKKKTGKKPKTKSADGVELQSGGGKHEK